MKTTTQEHDRRGRFSGNPHGRVVKRSASIDPDLYEALQNYADLYCNGVISAALRECLDRALNDTMFWDEAAARNTTQPKA